MEPVALRSIGRDIQKAFSKIVNSHTDSATSETSIKLPSSWEIESERQRFQLWAANLGLYSIGHRSLDYRLQDAASVRKYTFRLLQDLRDDLSRMNVLLSGKPLFSLEEKNETTEPSVSPIEEIADPNVLSPRSEKLVEEFLDNSEDEETQEHSDLQLLFDDAIDIINRLYKLAVKVRSATTRQPPSTQNFYRDHHDYRDEDGNEVKPSPEEISQARKLAREQCEKLHQRRIEDIIAQERLRQLPSSPISEDVDSPQRFLPIIQLFDHHTKNFIERMGRANAYRQQQFIFWRQQELGRRSLSLLEQDTAQVDVPGIPTGSHEKQSVVDGRKRIDGEALLQSEHPSGAPPPTWRLEGDLDIQVDDSKSRKSIITHTPTAYEPSGNKVGWPPFPKQVAGSKEFECPYCFVMCPTQYRGNAHWRTHLIQDLQPYMCTYPDCVEGDGKLLNGWEEWILHERLKHRVEYSCPEHLSLAFKDQTTYAEHVAMEHNSDKSERLKPEEIEKCASLMSKPDRACPLCPYDTGDWTEMEKHLAYHLESLALLALPQSTLLETGDDKEDDSQKVQAGPDGVKSSREGDFGSNPAALVNLEEAASVDPFETSGPLGSEIVSNPEHAEIDIWFVHGLSGNRRSTWTHEKTGCFWPELLANDFPEARVVTHGYDANLLKFATDWENGSIDGLKNHALGLAFAVRNLLLNKSARPLYFIAHSLGGLVVQKALLESIGFDISLHNVSSWTAGIFFFGVPHEGSHLARLGSSLRKLIPQSFLDSNKKVLDGLKKDSEVLHSLELDFEREAKHGKLKDIRLFSFYETLPLPGYGNLVVPERAAVLRADFGHPISGNHKSMTRFTGPDDLGYFKVKGQLAAWLYLEESLVASENPKRKKNEQASVNVQGPWLTGKLNTPVASNFTMGDSNVTQDSNSAQHIIHSKKRMDEESSNEYGEHSSNGNESDEVEEDEEMAV